MSHCGARYFLTIIDECSRSVWLYLLPTKQEVARTIRDFLALVERQFQKHVKTVRSDNGTEFMCLSSFFREKGILHETSCVHTPQQNGRVERKHRHILNVARALRFQSSLPLEFWGECILTAAYLINRTPTPLLKGKTPFDILYGRAPPLQHLRVVGSLCYAHNKDHRGDKFASRSIKCVFIGYPFGKKGWRVYDLQTHKIFTSRDVVFTESSFPFASSGSSVLPTPDMAPSERTLLIPEIAASSAPLLPSASDAIDELTPLFTPGSLITPPAKLSESPIDIISPPSELVLPHTPMPDIVVLSPEQTSSSTSSATSSDVSNPATSPSPLVRALDFVSMEDEIVTPAVALRRSTRETRLPTKLNDYALQITLDDPTLISSQPCSTTYFVESSQFSPSHCFFLSALTSYVTPKTYAEAAQDEFWRGAMGDEIGSLEESQTWTIESLPRGKRAIASKWVFTVKLRSDGSLERYKARLVACGNRQVSGTDFDETFAPVAKMATIRSFLEVSASQNWEVHQMDVHNAFLHGDLEEEVYMRLPPGFRCSDPTKVYRLRKSLYGLRQAPRCWFAKLSTALKEYGFIQSIPDYYLFMLERGSDRLHVLVYVDDLIISGSSPRLIANFKEYLSACFKMKDLGLSKYFLGIELARSPTGIYLSQKKYAMDIISEMGLSDAKPASFPLEQHHRLALAEGNDYVDVAGYRRLVGRLIYLAVTRPDLSYSVHVLPQFMQKPKQEHWNAALRVVRYLNKNPGQGILLRAHTELNLVAWCDSDFGSCPITRRSLTGWFIQLGDSPISWRTKKQHVVSRFSAEAEYRAMSLTVQEILWLKALLFDLGIDHKASIPLFCDSQAALHIASNPVFHERTKHIDRDCHFIRDELVRGTIYTRFVPTRDQLADIFTKALGKREFDEFIGKLGISDLHAPT
ncbi:Retrovirus-related Pol polyprotein from transposon RE1 [Cardamine amara subsp. amara]|uniref:Retrovirus-related Pol polyprotein from transposon RE1 n=1 Tax=Cardamine amara subsp. amara TaxID=228776 RepID=A0ABD1A1P7_CARAN